MTHGVRATALALLVTVAALLLPGFSGAASVAVPKASGYRDNSAVVESRVGSFRASYELLAGILADACHISEDVASVQIQIADGAFGAANGGSRQVCEGPQQGTVKAGP